MKDLLSPHLSLGALPGPAGTRFAFWSPRARRVTVVLPRDGVEHPMVREQDGTWRVEIAGLGPGDLYWLRVDDHPPCPDPASRYQPAGVHGPSAVVDASAFPWSDRGWPGLTSLAGQVIYELHLGTFTPEGSFRAAAERLPYLKELGVTLVELMPVADFPGGRNWGYDGVCLFAPARCYGAPDELRALVDRAHNLGLGVMLDVVYNHFGPDGAYLWSICPPFFNRSRPTPWGPAVNLDGRHSRGVRRFLIENALHWIQEYHLDGLRLDATWALLDRRRGRHFLAELAEAVEQAGRPALLVAEDHRNLNTLVRPRPGGWGLHGVWADDFHHQMRVHLTREREGYYADFTGRIEDLAETLRGGWFYRGQVSPRSGLPRGTDPLPLPPEAFVVCLQNHDQVGNRALGDRLHHSLPLAAWRAASTLLLSLPYTPLLFMGQEWAASTPFLFFTDHHPRLGPRITAGRRQEFRHFSAFSDPRVRQRIPDPQDPATFVRSRLDWSEADRPPHAGTLRLYRRLLALRRQEMGDQSRGSYSVEVLGPHSLLLWRGGLGVLVHLEGRASLPVAVGEVLLSTEDEEFVPDPRPARVGPRRVEFYRPGALVFRQGARRGGAQG